MKKIMSLTCAALVMMSAIAFGQTFKTTYIGTSSSNGVTLKPDAAGLTYTLELPPDDGSASGEVLTTNGSGDLSWSIMSGWNITGNAGTTAGTNFIGTTDNQAFEIHIFETDAANQGSKRVMRYEPNGSSANIIGGFQGNSITAGAVGVTIAGGGLTGAGNNNRVSAATATYATIGGGAANEIKGAAGGGTIAGGWGNTVDVGGGGEGFQTVGGGLGNQATGFGYATVAGGKQNTASAYSAFVGGGSTNTASNNEAFVGAGTSNVASGFRAAVVGGIGNAASGEHSGVVEGSGNDATDDYSFVGGGQNNQAGDAAGTTADRSHATVGGGSGNTASGQYSSVGGGLSNTASDLYAVVSGGNGNTAAGVYSAIPGGRGMTLDASADRSFGFLAYDGTNVMTISDAATAVFGNADLWLANNDNAARGIVFFEAYNTAGAFPNTANRIRVAAPSSFGSDYTLTLPPDDGATNQVLTTNGTGTLSWTTQPSGVYGGQTAGNSTGTSFASPNGEGENAAENLMQIVAPRAGTIQNLYIFSTAAPGAGESKTVTVRINGANSALTATISGAATTANSGAASATVAAGDLLSIAVTHSATPAASSVGWGFEIY